MNQLFITTLLLFNAAIASNTTQNWALEGYDVVSYFSNAQPLKGKTSIAVEWEGKVYLFSSNENSRMFQRHPRSYLPQYDGWCAYAMAKGKKVAINPKAFVIQENKLYLFYKTKWIDTQQKWLKKPSLLQSQADRHWNTIIRQ